MHGTADSSKRPLGRHAVFVRWRPLDVNAKTDSETCRSSKKGDTFEIQSIFEDEPTQTKPKWQSGEAFRKIFETDATNLEIFENCIIPILPRVLQGSTFNFFAYGHTGSGKTYTTTGDYETWAADVRCQGLVLKSAQCLFAEIDSMENGDTPARETNGFRLGLGLRMFELRKSDAYDLLNHRQKCFVRQGGDGKVHIRGETELLEDGQVRVRPVTQKACWSLDEFRQSLEEGLSLRSTGTSTVHDRSSRTHAILELELINQPLIEARDRLVDAESALVPVGKKATDIYLEEMSQSLIRTAEGMFVENPERPTNHARISAAEAERKLFEDRVDSAHERIQQAFCTASPILLGGKIVFADLAGAEFYSANKTANTTAQSPQELQEGRQINTDLLALKEVIRAWSLGKSHIPYRSSALTMVLREHFANSESGMSATILTVAAAASQFSATMNTLKYGKLIGGG